MTQDWIVVIGYGIGVDIFFVARCTVPDIQPFYVRHLVGCSSRICCFQKQGSGAPGSGVGAVTLARLRLKF